MIISVKNSKIVFSSDSMPLDPEENLPEKYIQSLISGGVIPWYWDLEMQEFHLPSFVSEEIQISGSLADSIHLSVSEKDALLLVESLEDSCRKETFADVLFRAYRNGKESIQWCWLKGSFIRREGRLVGASGQLLNLSWLVKKIYPLPDLSEFYKTIVDMIPLPIFYKDTHRIFRYHNKAFNDVINLVPGQINGKTVFDIEPASLAGIFDQADLELIEKPGLQVYDCLVRYGDGTFHDVTFHKTPVLSPSGKIQGVAGVMMDMTEMKKAIEKSERLLKMKDLALKINQAILNISDLKAILEILLEEVTHIIPKADCGSILLLDEKNVLRMEASFGFVMDERNPFFLRYEDSFLWETNSSPGEVPTIIPDRSVIIMSENHPPCPDTITGIPIQSTLSAPIRSGDKLLGLLSLDSYKKNIFNDSDMEIIRYLQEQLAVLLDNQNTFQNILNQSRYDSMTGLISRQFFDEQLHDAIKRAGRNNTSFVIVLMDMDNLKIINDRWGHMAGDKVIRVFSSAISRGFRSTDLFGRLGGDEFGGIIFDTSLEAVEKKFSSLQSEAPGVELGERYFPCAFSYGIAEFGKNGKTAEDLLDKADYKMYRMKRSRKKSSDSLSGL